MQRRRSAVGVNTDGVLGKRHAPDDSTFDFERFNKRLNLLSIAERNGNSTRYTTVSSQPPKHPQHHVTRDGSHGRHSDDPMRVDDTKDRVYIHDLDEELADLDPPEEEEERLIFLPDIEKQLSKLPQQVLLGRRDDEVQEQQQELVLYGAPKSLTMDEGYDPVRKAIVEARQRARDKAIEDARREDMDRKYDHSGHAGAVETAHGYSGGYGEENDPDAMDLG